MAYNEAMNRRGFTLVELLIAVGIIAILAGFILASYGPAKQKAQDSRRVSDIAQLQTALESYFEDPINGSQYPPTTVQTNTMGVLAWPCLSASGSDSSFTTSGLACLSRGGYISTLPTDPQTGTSYGYYANPTANPDTGTSYQAYCLGAELADPNTAGNAMQSAHSSCDGVTWCPLLNNSSYNYVVCRQ